MEGGCPDLRRIRIAAQILLTRNDSDKEKGNRR